VSDRYRTLEIEDEDVAFVAVGAAGLLVLVIGIATGSRFLRLLGFASAAAGSGLLVRRKLAERNEMIDSAKDTIRSELDDLDPVARAQVLADIARSQL